MTVALEGGESSATRPGRTLPPRKTRYPLYRRLGGPHGRYGQAEILAPPRFDPRTVQPVVSLYPAHVQLISHVNCPGIDLIYSWWDRYQTKETVREVCLNLTDFFPSSPPQKKEEEKRIRLLFVRNRSKMN
jgi:hypothetical protein